MTLRSPLAVLASAFVVGLLLGAPASAAVTDVFTVAGTVHGPSGVPLAGVTIASDGGVESVTTDADGRYALNLPAGTRQLVVSSTGYRPVARPIEVLADVADVDFVLEPLPRVSESLLVEALRAGEAAPVAKAEISTAEVARLNYGQEMPFLLGTTPSVTSYSESGLAAGGGYSYFSLRGINQTRINMTFDGVPLNDPEESAVYFANFGDFTSALSSIQVQRGVGTSTVGAASYGGAINFASVDLAEKPGTALDLAGGSFGTERASLAWESGRLASGLALYARLSYQDSDGFRERSGVRQRTLFVGGDWRGAETYVKVFGFSGRENTSLAFLAVQPEILEHDLRFNPMQPEELDTFGQDVYYVQASRALGRWATAAQLYYNGAQGHFELFDDPATKTDLRSYAITGRTLGLLTTASSSGAGWQLTTGLHGYTFARDHFSSLVGGPETYRNTGRKWEVSGFAKLGWDFDPRWHLFADLQVRHAEFEYDGTVDMGPVDWTFVNPRLGVRFALTERLGLFASIGRSAREPARNDLLEGADDVAAPIDLRAVKPERVMDYELGAEWRGDRSSASLNLYDMEFRNEIAATGEQSDLGYAIRRNLGRSYRRGLELALRWHPADRWQLDATADLARNRIATWRQTFDLYNENGYYIGYASRTFHDTPPYLSPERIFAASLVWRPAGALAFTLAGRHVGRAYLDNTGDRRLSAKPYSLLDAGAELDLSRWLPYGNPRLRVQANNVLDEHHAWPSGYSYPYLVQDAGGNQRLQGIPYYYPLATRHYLASLALRF